LTRQYVNFLQNTIWRFGVGASCDAERAVILEGNNDNDNSRRRRRRRREERETYGDGDSTHHHSANSAP